MEQVLKLLTQQKESILSQTLRSIYETYKSHFESFAMDEEWNKLTAQEEENDDSIEEEEDSTILIPSLIKHGFFQIPNAVTCITLFEDSNHSILATIGSSHGTIFQYSQESSQLYFSLLEKLSLSSQPIISLYFQLHSSLLLFIHSNFLLGKQYCSQNTSQINTLSNQLTDTEFIFQSRNTTIHSVFLLNDCNVIGFTTKDDYIGLYHLETKHIIWKPFQIAIQFVIATNSLFNREEFQIVFVVVDQKNRMSVWQLTTDQLQCTREINIYEQVHCAAFSPDNSLLAVGLENGSIQLFAFEMTSVTLLCDISLFHTMPILFLKFHPMQFWLLVITKENHIAVVDLESKECIFVEESSVASEEQITCATLSELGNELWIGCQSGTVYVFGIPQKE